MKWQIEAAATSWREEFRIDTDMEVVPVVLLYRQVEPDYAAVAEAEKRFMGLTGAGFTAAKRLGQGKREIVRSFGPTAEETLFIPRLKVDNRS